jgi:hypothetical protein
MNYTGDKHMPDPDLSAQQQRIIAEMKRVAKKLGTNQLSQNDFDEHHELGGVTTAGMLFGSWNLAIKAAGLTPYPSGGPGPRRITDDELLEELIRVHKHFGKMPSERNVAAIGNYSLTPYKERWGSIAKAREVAYLRFGEP